MTALLTAATAGLAVLLALPAPPRLGVPGREQATTATRPARLRRPVLAVLAGVGASLFVGGDLAPVIGVASAAAAWWWLGTIEPAEGRRARECAARDLPALVALLGAGLRAGAAPEESVRLAGVALPGPAADRLAGVAERLALGADPAVVWAELADDDALSPLGRCLARAHETGSSVVDAVDRLGAELEQEQRAVAEARARSVGVRAAVPLGLCLLPSFLLLGIVPLAAGLLREITP